MLTLQDLQLETNEDNERLLLIVNAYIKNKGVVFPNPIPKAIIQAGKELVTAFESGQLLAGRDDGIVTSKSATAGDVSVSKTYAQGSDGLPMSSEQMIADELLKPYIVQSGGVNVILGRI